MQGYAVLNEEKVKQLSMSLLSEEQEEKFWAYKDIDLSFSYGDRARFRVNVYQQTGK